MRSWSSFLVLSFFLVACHDPDDASSDPAAARAPLAKADCGDVVFGNGAAQCPADREPKLDCFLEAKRTCGSARLGLTYTSDEGGLTVFDLVVDDACRVFVKTDTTGDPYAAKPGVTTSTCAAASRIAIGQDATACTTVDVDDCR